MSGRHAAVMPGVRPPTAYIPLSAGYLRVTNLAPYIDARIQAAMIEAERGQIIARARTRRVGRAFRRGAHRA